MIVARGADASTRLDGFVIRDGLADTGAGLWIEGGTPVIVGCEFTSNSARLGSAVMVIDASPVLERCVIHANVSLRSGEGTGIYAMTTGAAGPQRLTIRDSDIRSNSAMQGHFTTGNGAGIYCGPGVDLVMERCTVRNNFAFHNQTYGNATTGGGLSFRGGTALIRDSVFFGNYAAFGAGIYSEGTLICTNCVFIGNRAVRVSCVGPECNGVPDRVSGYGGGVYATQASLIGCTFNANWAFKTGAGAYIAGSIENCIFWGNRVYPPCCGENPVPPPRDQIDGNTSIAFSCIEGLLAPIPGEDPPNPADYPGSIDADPLFASAYVVSASGGGLITATGDVHLVPGSPCIDSADNALVPAEVLTDADGRRRFVDDPDTPNGGQTVDTPVDMGAYEYQTPGPGDFNGDLIVDLPDHAMFISCMTGPAGEQPPMACPDIRFVQADANDDGRVDLRDWAGFQRVFDP